MAKSPEKNTLRTIETVVILDDSSNDDMPKLTAVWSLAGQENHVRTNTTEAKKKTNAKKRKRKIKYYPSKYARRRTIAKKQKSTENCAILSHCEVEEHNWQTQPQSVNENLLLTERITKRCIQRKTQGQNKTIPKQKEMGIKRKRKEKKKTQIPKDYDIQEKVIDKQKRENELDKCSPVSIANPSIEPIVIEDDDSPPSYLRTVNINKLLPDEDQVQQNNILIKDRQMMEQQPCQQPGVTIRLLPGQSIVGVVTESGLLQIIGTIAECPVENLSKNNINIDANPNNNDSLVTLPINISDSAMVLNCVDSSNETSLSDLNVNTSYNCDVVSDPNQVNVLNGQNEVNILNGQNEVNILNAQIQVYILNEQNELNILNEPNELNILNEPNELNILNEHNELNILNEHNELNILNGQNQVNVLNRQNSVENDNAVSLVNGKTTGAKQVCSDGSGCSKDTFSQKIERFKKNYVKEKLLGESLFRPRLATSYLDRDFIKQYEKSLGISYEIKEDLSVPHSIPSGAEMESSKEGVGGRETTVVDWEEQIPMGVIALVDKPIL